MIKSKYGWQMWSNGYVNLFYLDGDASFFVDGLSEDYSVLDVSDWAVAEEDLESGVMKRTEYGKSVFSHSIKSRDALTNEVKRLKINESHN